VLTQLDLNTQGLGRILELETRDVVEGLHNYLEFSQPFSCLDEAM